MVDVETEVVVAALEVDAATDVAAVVVVTTATDVVWIGVEGAAVEAVAAAAVVESDIGWVANCEISVWIAVGSAKPGVERGAGCEFSSDTSSGFGVVIVVGADKPVCIAA